MKKMLFLLAISAWGCNDAAQKAALEAKFGKEATQRYFSLERVAELKEKAVKHGDEEAFRLLIDHYGNTAFENYELIPIALIMADRYHSDVARSAIYFSFLDLQNQGRDQKGFFALDNVKAGSASHGPIKKDCTICAVGKYLRQKCVQRLPAVTSIRKTAAN